LPTPAPTRTGRPRWRRIARRMVFFVASVVLVIAFCLGGRRITQADYPTAFSWSLFAVGLGLGVVVCVRALARGQRPGRSEVS